MKRRRILTAVLVCLLLCGCKPSGIKEGTSPTLSAVPEEKDVAFTCYNYDFDLYLDCSWTPGPSFYVLTREYVDPSRIGVSVPVSNPYRVFVFDALEGNDHYQLTTYQESAEEGGYPYAMDSNQMQYQAYLYQTSRGIDWEPVGQYRLRSRELNDQWLALYEQDLAGTQEAKDISEELGQAQAEHEKLANAYIEEYRQLTPEDLPTFYMYQVNVVFEYQPDGGLGDESFRQIEVLVGEESYTVDIGEIRIHNDSPENNTYVDDDAMVVHSSGDLNYKAYPYSPGIDKRDGFTLRADEDVTMLSCGQLEGSTCSAEILEIQLTIDGMDIVWDGKTPIQVPKGTYVKFTFVIQDERMKEAFYGENLYPTVTYEHDGEVYTLTSQLNLYRMTYEPWLWYTLCLQGLDMESYFRDYYYYAVDTAWKEYQS